MLYRACVNCQSGNKWDFPWSVIIWPLFVTALGNWGQLEGKQLADLLCTTEDGTFWLYLLPPVTEILYPPVLPKKQTKAQKTVKGLKASWEQVEPSVQGLCLLQVLGGGGTGKISLHKCFTIWTNNLVVLIEVKVSQEFKTGPLGTGGLFHSQGGKE